MNRIRMPIIARSLGVVLVCALVPLVLSWTMTVPRGIRALEDTARQNLQIVAQVTATQLDQLFVDISRLQGCLATDAVLVRFCLTESSRREALAAQVKERLRDILAANGDITLAYVADSGGTCTASSVPEMIGTNYGATRLYIREALCGRQCISDMAVGLTTKEPGVYMAGPVIDVDKRTIGVLVLKLRGQVIDSTCEAVAQRVAGGFAAVVDSRGVIVSHPDPAALYCSVGDHASGTALDVDPRLQYGVAAVKSLGMNALAEQLRQNQAGGSLAWVDRSDNSQIAGYAAMTVRPWQVIVVQPRSVFDQPIVQLQQRQTLVFIGSLMGSALLTLVFVGKLAKPIKSLSSAADRLAKGDWTVRANSETNDELGDLARTFNDMVPKLQERTKMEDALRLAMEIQRHLLPHKPPEIDGADVAGVSLPADETGGDYYDFLDLSTWEKATLAVAVGDVTGHGISAALLMTTARALLRSRATPPGSLAELIADVNARLCDDTPEGRFMTLMYIVLDCRAREARLISAGHDPALYYRPDTDEFSELRGSDLPLGLDKDAFFTEVRYANLVEGGILTIGTDGIWETLNADQEQYGKQRLCAVIRRHGNASAQQIVDEILADLAAFRGEIAQQDDVTLVVVKLRTAAPGRPGQSQRG